MNHFDFKTIAEKSKLYNFHSHTQFCDGRDTMDTFARAAVEAGLTHYGFTPHSPIPIGSPCNMTKDDVPVYLAEVARIRREYGPTEFLAGMEIDYLGYHWGPHTDYFQSLPLDYRIGSVHFIPTRSGERYVDIDGRYESFRRKMTEYFNDDLRYVVETFYAQSIAMVRAGGFDVLGHLDKIGHNASMHQPHVEDEPWYQDAARELLREVIASGVTVEVNTKAYEQAGRIFPSEHLLSQLLRAGVPVIVNSDAHYADRILAGRNYGLSLV